MKERKRHETRKLENVKTLDSLIAYCGGSSSDVTKVTLDYVWGNAGPCCSIQVVVEDDRGRPSRPRRFISNLGNFWEVDFVPNKRTLEDWDLANETRKNKKGFRKKVPKRGIR